MIAGSFFSIMIIGIIIGWFLIKRHQHRVKTFDVLLFSLIPFLIYVSFYCFTINPKMITKNQTLLAQQTELIAKQNQEIKLVALAKPNSDDAKVKHQDLVHTTHRLMQVNQTLKHAQLTPPQYQTYQDNQKRQQS